MRSPAAITPRVLCRASSRRGAGARGGLSRLPLLQTATFRARNGWWFRGRPLRPLLHSCAVRNRGYRPSVCVRSGTRRPYPYGWTGRRPSPPGSHPSPPCRGSRCRFGWRGRSARMGVLSFLVLLPCFLLIIPGRRIPSSAPLSTFGGRVPLTMAVSIHVKTLRAFLPVERELQAFRAPEIALFEALARQPGIEPLHVLALRLGGAAHVLVVRFPLQLILLSFT